ncbi:hypothetical protein [Viscerimonas tarda]
MIKRYRKYIAENRGLIYLSTFLVVLLRLGLLFATADSVPEEGDFIPENLDLPFESRYVLFICSLLFTIGIGLQLTHLNIKYALIRGKTSLPYVFALFLLSSSPGLICAISPYIGIVAVLWSVNILFSSYQEPKASKQAFGIGVILALASFAIPSLLIYLIVFWVGFSVMRSFSFKVFLASLFAVVMVYWPVFLYLFFVREQDDALSYFVSGWNNFFDFSILEMDIKSVIILLVCAATAIIILINNHLSEFKDKIQVRANFAFLRFMLLFSALIYLLFSQHFPHNWAIAIVIAGFILSHFFALANKKWKVCFFILVAVFYFANYACLFME